MFLLIKAIFQDSNFQDSNFFLLYILTLSRLRASHRWMLTV